MDGKSYLVKKDTTWNYQIQVQLAMPRLTRCILIKGTLVAPVQFDEELWEHMVGKLRKLFFEL